MKERRERQDMKDKNRSEPHMSDKASSNSFSSPGPSYREAGVDIGREEKSLKTFLSYITQTFPLVREGPGQVLSSIGYFANIIKITDTLCLAVSADGVGTKVLIAQMMNKYDTVGIDCIAMNVNDIICIGATPVSFLNYLALQEPREDLMEQLGRGFLEGARQAGVPIPGGETAQVRDLIQGVRPGYGFDVAGVGLGVVERDRIIEGQDLADGDIIVGLASSGLHSNGYSLARRILFGEKKYRADSFIPELNKTLGEELLTPTTIYVPVIKELLLNQKVRLKALINITGDGLLNLLRVKPRATFTISSLPDTPPIFSLLQQLGNISDEEMFSVFNMGIGFCVLIHPDDFDTVKAVCHRFGLPCFILGQVTLPAERVVHVVSKGLKGIGRTFCKT
jgi:phosphoribosylformylglycinamidine cyclo-ligase